MDPKYKHELSEDDSNNEITALDECLEKILDLDSLLEALYEFIETHVKYLTDHELQWK